jgi:DNA helicase-2/ATP-dependent DNA helicase PcrA
VRSGRPESQQSEQAIYLDRGIEALRAFLASNQAQFLPTDLTELRFANQGVHVGDAQLTGALDAVHVNPENKSLTVVDYKTGKPALSWKGASEFEKIKLHKYRQQLMFYQLLIENSRDYSGYHFDCGILQFVEPTTSGSIIALDQQFTRDELDEFTQLIQAVWRRIIALDLPDTSSYEPTIKGILQFEQNLLDNK